MSRRYLLLVPMLALSPLAKAASGLDLSINNDAARGILEFDISNNVVVDGNWYYHQDRGNIFGAGIHVVGAATSGPDPARAGVGARLLRIDSDSQGRDSGGALPIGGFVAYTLPDYNRFVLGGSFYYAPEVLSFSDVEEYWEASAWGAYNVLRTAQVYLGLRTIKADFEDSPKVTFDTGLHVGIRLRF
jgi:hypothetical protein